MNLDDTNRVLPRRHGPPGLPNSSKPPELDSPLACHYALNSPPIANFSGSSM